ncbi:putative cytochrome P450, partial [Aureobasidium melanogenum]
MVLTTPATFAILGFVLLVLKALTIGHRRKDCPPGPPTIPILGNIHQMPKRDAHLQFQKWANEYGPIYSLMLGTRVLIVLSSDQAVKDLLDKRSAIYSAREDMYVGQTLCSGGMRFLMMEYGPTWRYFRKMCHALLNVNVARTYVPYQLLENKQMLYEMLVSPDRCLQNIRRYSNALTTTMIFGWRTPTYEDDAMKQLYEGFSEFVQINQTGTAALLDSFPLLRKLPDWLFPLQARAKEAFKKERKLYVGHWLTAKKTMKAGTIRPCFCVGMAQAQQEEGFSDDQAAYITGTLLEAGSDTTASTLYAFVQAMLLFPTVQKKAQEEIDRVVGKDRLPIMEDEPKLQYIRGCVKESLRWMPTTILGAVPHAVIRDDTYMGYKIPKGAGVMNNVWAIHMDHNRSPEPRRFDPDRFKDDFLNCADSATQPDASKRDSFTFGAGRRICQGMHVAERSLFLGISRMLWAFDINPVIDSATGEEILPDPDRLTQGILVMPEEYKVNITPRDRIRADLIKKEWQEAEELLDPITKQWKQTPKDSIDNAKPHDKAMKLLEEAGIYVVAGVSTPFSCIRRNTPYKSYNTANVSSFLTTAGIMAGYVNTLAIVAANSLVNNQDSLRATPVLKAVVRDLKRFLVLSNEKKGTRILPDFWNTYVLAQKRVRLTFWGQPKNYKWAGANSSMQVSGWNALINHYEKFAVPVFLSEYGSNIDKPRQFHETQSLYSDPMTKVFSGGCVYEFADGNNNYGLAAIPGSDEGKWFGTFRLAEKKVIETRETDQGNLYIYHDFANYKAALAESTDYDPSWDTMERQVVERHNTGMTQMTWPWDPEYQMPATCMDWDNIEELVGR